MQDSQRAAGMGANGQKWVRENLDVKKMTDSYIALYRKFVNKKPGRVVQTPLLVNN